MNNRGVSGFSVGIFLSHSAKYYQVKPCIISESLGYQKVLCIMRWYHDFPSKIRVPQYRKTSLGEPFCVWKKT